MKAPPPAEPDEPVTAGMLRGMAAELDRTAFATKSARMQVVKDVAVDLRSLADLVPDTPAPSEATALDLLRRLVEMQAEPRPSMSESEWADSDWLLEWNNAWDDARALLERSDAGEDGWPAPEPTSDQRHQAILRDGYVPNGAIIPLRLFAR